MAGVGAAASLGGSAMQAGAAENAQQLQAQEASQALQFQEQQWNTEQANQAPFLKAGQGAVAELSSLTGTPGQGLLTPYGQTFQAPTLAQAEQQPGYQFALQQGEQAMQNSAAASGELLDPNTQRALQNYGQNAAETDYNNVYNQALSTYGTNFNVYQQNQANEFNRLAAVAGVGQTAVGQLGQEGQAASGNVGNIMLTSGAQQGQDMQNAAAAMASGFTGAANSTTGALSNYEQYMMLQNLFNQTPSDAAGLGGGF